MKTGKPSHDSLFFTVLLIPAALLCFIFHSESEAAPAEGFRVPLILPHTDYSITIRMDAAANRMEGKEEIRIENPSKTPLRRLLIEWPYANSEAMEIVCGSEPVALSAKGKNGLSSEQTLVELPREIKLGESAVLGIRFGFPQRMDPVANLEGWYPRLGWGRETADDYEVRVETPKGWLLAASGVYDEAERVYRAAGCRKFGLVFMKDFKVLQDQTGDVTVCSYYDDDSRACVERIHQTALEAIDFYRTWLGFYPQEVLHIVPGGLKHLAGGYPVATGIVGIHGQNQMDSMPKTHWQFITAHEIGHQYWMEHVLESPNAFWLMIGLGVYADREFMRAKGYGDQHERDMIGRYLRAARDMPDTRMDRLPEEMNEVDFDYNNVVEHGKGFGVISSLACVMGKESFESAYRKCLNEFKGRTLDVSDFQQVCENESGESLDWFFEEWVRTARYLTYEIASRETTEKDGEYVTTATVRKTGTIAIPVPVTALFEDGTSQHRITDRLLEENTLVFTSHSPVKELVLDARHELPLLCPAPNPQTARIKKEIQNLKHIGDGEKALIILREMKDTKPDDPNALFKLAGCLFDGGYYAEALPIFQTCAENSAASDPIFRYLGLLWQGHMLDLLNRREEAMPFYRRAMECCPDAEIHHDQYGIIVDRAWVERRLESPFTRPDPKILDLKNRIDALGWTGEGDKALPLFQEALGLKNDVSAFDWFKLGLCLYDGKHYTESLRAFEKNAEQNPASFAGWVWQGHLLDLMSRREEALKFYQRALDMNPTSSMQHNQYGMIINADWIRERLKTPFQR